MVQNGCDCLRMAIGMLMIGIKCTIDVSHKNGVNGCECCDSCDRYAISPLFWIKKPPCQGAAGVWPRDCFASWSWREEMGPLSSFNLHQDSHLQLWFGGQHQQLQRHQQGVPPADLNLNRYKNYSFTLLGVEETS